MTYFTPLDAHVLLRANGIFSEHQVYANAKNELFARKGNGFIRLMDHAATSKSKVFWDDLHFEDRKQGSIAKHGRLILTRAGKPAVAVAA